MLKAWRVVVTGVVQGVGFRPFVYRIAHETGLKGYVRNLGGSEVEIWVEGEESQLRNFLQLLEERKPPPAEVSSVRVEKVSPRGFRDFRIRKSGKTAREYSMIPPDIGICRWCLEEILSEGNRRHGYALNSCAWCGPRFSMIYSVPYDRENTSMKEFPLCEECLREYEDQHNLRRFHAEGTCCPSCGPRLWLEDPQGEVVDEEKPIETAAKLVEEGYLVAVKGIGGFHIAALATEDGVVLKLRKRKRRPQQPFALMALNLEVVEKVAYVDEKSAEMLSSPSRPIVLLPEREDSPLSPYVAPGLSHQGIMLPYTGIHYLLLGRTKDKILIMTSGNPKGEPMCTRNEEARERLRGIADFFLTHNRKIVNRVDDSVVRKTGEKFVFIRRGRGYAPKWLSLPFHLKKPIVALGAELQTAGAVAFRDKVVLTQFIGDLDNLKALEDLERYLLFFVRNYRIDLRESLLVLDKHPLYKNRLLASKWSSEFGCPVLEVQHHHAHALACLVEKGEIEGVAIAIDGIGYGEDGAIWGGEVLEVRGGDFRRVGHIDYMPMPGGDRAVEYPVRMLVGILSKFMRPDEIESIILRKGLDRGLAYGKKELEICLKQTEDAPKTSSLGRTLDAVSAFLGVCLKRTYEGEPAIKLESLAMRGKLLDGLEAPIRARGGEFVIDVAELFERMLSLNAEPKDLAFSAQWALGESFAELALKKSPNTVYLSGGAAVNDIIYRAMRRKLEEEGVSLVINELIPPGDGGIAVGQAVAGALSLGLTE